MPAPSILIVEDEGIAAVNLEQKIVDLGYQSAGIAFSADEALDKARAQAPDLILLDIQLRGGKDGIQFAEALQTELDVPIVFVTAYSDDFTIQRAKQTSAFGYLIKPLREESIRSAVELALQKHRSERQLRTSERRFRSVFEKSHFGIAICNRDHRIERVNSRLAHLLQALPQDLRGKSLAEFFELKSTQGPELEDGVECRFLEDRKSKGLEERWAKITRDCMGDDADGSFHCMFYIDDISDAKAKQLQLIEAKVSAENGYRHRQELIAYLGREFQTPLSAMMDYADLLYGRVLEENERRIFLQRIRSSGEYLASFLQEILEFSKVELGNIPLHQSRLNLPDLLSEIITLLNVQAEIKGLSFELHIDPGVPRHIVSDATLLKKVLINVVGNAIKFTDSGSVRLQCLVDGALGASQVVVRVVDTGRGIAAHEQVTLFYPFSFLEGSTRKLYSGAGLGLSLSKRWADALGGSLKLVASEVDRGSSFELRLPLS